MTSNVGQNYPYTSETESDRASRLATLVADAPLFSDVEQLRWRGPTAASAEMSERLGDARVLARSQKSSAA